MSAGVYFFIIRYSFSDFYKRLEIRGVVTARATLDHEEATAAVLQEMREMHLEKLPGESEYFIKITPGKTFEKEAAELNLPISFFEETLTNGEASHQNDDTFFAGIPFTGKAGSFIVIISADNYYNSHLQAYLRNIFLIAVSCATIFSLIISIILSRVVFNPVKEITERVNRISSQNLNLRLSPRRTNDEITTLEITFNKMLDRLQAAFETQNNFISNASHELSTPLTTIIGEAEVTLTKERNSQEYTEALRSILGQAERLEKIIRSLLFLAQTGFNRGNLSLEDLRADQLLWDVKATIEKINPRNKIQLNMSLMPENPDTLFMKGNEQLLHLALSNLVSNACKYSHFQPVILSLGTSEDRIIMVIKDTGIGIPEAELKFIYDPFFRASNAKNYEGYGIGLPLSQNIIRHHEGEIKISSILNEGTTVQISFPSLAVSNR